MTIMNSNGDCEYPWKIPLCIFASAKLLLPVVNFTLQVFMVFSMNFIISIAIIIIIIIVFTSALADSLPLEPEWQQVSSSLQDSNQYFGSFQ